MTREEAINFLENISIYQQPDSNYRKALEIACEALKEFLTLKEAYQKGYKDGQEALAFHLELCKEEQEPFINKPCVSSGVCEHDKQRVLDKIRAEIEELPKTYPFINHIDSYVKEDDVRKIIDKYTAESEDKIERYN